MDTISVAPKASQINRHACEEAISSIAWTSGHQTVEECLLSLFVSIDDAIPIDDALAVCTIYVPEDPYLPIRDVHAGDKPGQWSAVMMASAAE